MGVVYTNNPTKIELESIFIRRELKDGFMSFFEKKHFIALIGPRRSGKTTLLKHIQERLPNSIYLSFEDDNLLDLFDDHIKTFAHTYIEPYKTIFIDEFQYAQKGGKNLKYLFDFYAEKGIKIVISGSSSIDITLKVARFMMGRLVTFTLYPLSFLEFLSVKDNALEKAVRTKKSEIPNLAPQLIDYFGEYLVYGGYPEVVLERDPNIKKRLLKSIYELYLAKDVSSLGNFVSDWKLKKLIKTLSANLGGIVNYSTLQKNAGIEFKTLKNYLSFLEKTFITVTVTPFFSNKLKEVVKNPKIYLLDTGLRNSLIDSFEPFPTRADKGILLESYVATNILRQEFTPYYWRTKGKAEVDFVAKSGENLLPIEVKSMLSEFAIPRSLRTFPSSLCRYSPTIAVI